MALPYSTGPMAGACFIVSCVNFKSKRQALHYSCYITLTDLYCTRRTDEIQEADEHIGLVLF